MRLLSSQQDDARIVQIVNRLEHKFSQIFTGETSNDMMRISIQSPMIGEIWTT